MNEDTKDYELVQGNTQPVIEWTREAVDAAASACNVVLHKAVSLGASKEYTVNLRSALNRLEYLQVEFAREELNGKQIEES